MCPPSRALRPATGRSTMASGTPRREHPVRPGSGSEPAGAARAGKPVLLFLHLRDVLVRAWKSNRQGLTEAECRVVPAVQLGWAYGEVAPLRELLRDESGDESRRDRRPLQRQPGARNPGPRPRTAIGLTGSPGDGSRVEPAGATSFGVSGWKSAASSWICARPTESSTAPRRTRRSPSPRSSRRPRRAARPTRTATASRSPSSAASGAPRCPRPSGSPRPT